MMSKPIRMIVADDHPVVREGLVAILSTQADFEVVAEANNGDVLLTHVKTYQPDIVLTDLEMPEVDGVAAIRQIHGMENAPGIIAFTAFDTDERILGAIQAGAKGYLLKGAPRDDIFRAIRTVAAGGSLLEPEITTRLLAHISG
ncbi:MAG: response regulator, partial [Aggregatilineales bacterium]